MKKMLFVLPFICSVALADSEQVKVQVVYTKTTPYGDYTDAIYYPDMATYQSKKSDGTLETEKSLRIDNYLNAIQNPPPFVEPTKEELQAQKAELQKQMDSLDAQIAAK